VPNGVPDLGRAAPPSPRRSLVAALVGRVDDHKRPYDFLTALRWARHQGADVTGLVLGDGPLLEEVRASVLPEERDLVWFAGFVEDPAEALLDVDVLLLMSDTEGGLPLAAMEAASLSRGTVARATVEGVELLGGGAFVLPPGASPRDFGSALVALAQDRALRTRLGRAARTAFERGFSAEAAADRLAEVYEAAGRGPRARLRRPCPAAAWLAAR
ncbi:MAG TPA: glycosyltransferase, partial [Acidimicrobiales bacterium]